MPTAVDGIYVIMGTDHGQGTAQFLICILLGCSDIRRQYNRLDYNICSIKYATIKCKKDPYEKLKLTKEESNMFINQLSNHKFLALTNDNGHIRCMFVDKKSTNYYIIDCVLVASGPDFEKHYPIHNDILGTNIRYRLIFNSFHAIQVGDLAAQMTLQGREGMASLQCIKCNLTQKE